MSKRPRILLASLLIIVLVAACAKATETPAVIDQTEEAPPATEEVVVERTSEPQEEYESAEDGDSNYVMPEATPAPLPTATPPSANPNDPPYATTFYEDYGVNPRIDTQDDHLSTFAVDVDTASYAIMRRVVLDGYLPAQDSVRVEEYINYFNMDYPLPDEEAFAIHINGSESPWVDNYHIVRVGLQGYEVPPEERPDAVLTFVVDVSGSMSQENRLGLVKDALKLLVDELRPTDKVGLVIYGSEADVLLEPDRIANRRIILRAIERLQPGGSTNAEHGLMLAYDLAREYYDPNAINRVILCSDGVANVGRTDHEALWDRIERDAGEGIYLTTVGFGMGNYNDVLMEQLADNGNGFYAYVDDIIEAERVFVDRLPSALQVIAKDAKVQVDFNPEQVRSYRLIGYENRDVADEDFRDDRVDAGEIGPGHSVTALYEVKFEQDAAPTAPALTVFMRWEDPDTGEITEIDENFRTGELATEFLETDPHFMLAVVVSQYAEILRDSYWAEEAETSLRDIVELAEFVADMLPNDPDVQEFADLVDWAANL